MADPPGFAGEYEPDAAASAIGRRADEIRSKHRGVI
jgi:hypothetical protein